MDRPLFSLQSHKSKGRTCMFVSSILAAIASSLTAGIFYTGFLIANDIKIVNIGIISFVPFIANIFGVFSPLILEKFKKRKLLLCTCKLLFYILNIGGITILPLFNLTDIEKTIMFALIAFVANLLNSVASSGYSVWHFNFLPEKIRADYFSIQQITSAAIGGVVVLSSSYIADILRQSGQELEIIMILRVIAFAIALVDVYILTIPKEYPYISTSKIKLKDVFVIPFKNKPFFYTMTIVFIWNIVLNLTITPLDVYLLNDVKISYTLINVVNALYAVFLFAFAPLWKRVLKKYSWFKTFALTICLNAPMLIVYSFINHDNYLWLFVIVRLCQHVVGVGVNLSYANMAYINLPKENQTNYMSFFLVLTNLASFFGQMLGTLFIGLGENINLTLFGFNFKSVQMLLWVQFVLQVFAAFYVIKILPKVQNKL